MNLALGIDTSNYTTSLALYDAQAHEICQVKRLLPVKEGEKGLRQSDAVLHHVQQLPELMDKLWKPGCGKALSAVGVSARPRDAEGSYMPCFLAGESQGRGIADTLGVPFFPCAHQQGHIAAAAWSAGRPDLLDRPHLAWHLSGGTTELLYVQPDGVSVWAQKLGGTSDISAGQLIDRTGQLLGLPFPAGKALDGLYGQADVCQNYTVKINDLTFSLSGMENKVRELVERGTPPANVARFVVDTVVKAVLRTTDKALEQYPGLPVLCSGGVASNSALRAALRDAVFAPPQYSTDNALGVAILARRALTGGSRL